MANQPIQPSHPPEQPRPALPATTRRLLGALNVVAALLLFYLAALNFLAGRVLLPLGFVLMGLYFLYAYLTKARGVNLGRTGVAASLLLQLGALVCLLIGLLNNS